MIGSGKTVCVTGASGFIASWLVKLLLQRGYTVKATVRDPANPKKTNHLLALDEAKERLQLFKADLLEDGSFDIVVDGCDGVFHTASPVFHNPEDPQTELIVPAVKGTLNVLKSVAKTPSVKRVVFTSSLAAVVCNPNLNTPGYIFDETCFSDEDYCRELKWWYRLSKTMAEKEAWNFVKEKGIDMVVINPGLVLGASVDPTLNFGAAEVLNMINGAETYRNTNAPWVHVKDVVEAHIQAFENQSAKGRYCLVDCSTHLSEAVNILRQLYPNLPLPTKCVDEGICMEKYEVSNVKSKGLGIEYIPLKVSLKDTVESLKENKYVSF